MLILIKLIHLLNRQIMRVKATLCCRKIVEFQAVCVVLALSPLGGVNIESARAASLNLDRRSAASSNVATQPAGWQAIRGDRRKNADFLTKVIASVPAAATQPQPQILKNQPTPPRNYRKVRHHNQFKLSKLVTDVLIGASNAPDLPATADKPTDIHQPVRASELGVFQLDTHTFQIDSYSAAHDRNPAKQLLSSRDRQRRSNLAPSTSTAALPTATLRSLTLKEAIHFAVRNNNELQAARLAVNKSQAGVSVARAARSVQVELLGNLGKQGTPAILNSPLENSNNFENSNNPQNILATGNNGEANATNVGMTVQATYNLLNSGRDTANIRMTEAQVKLSRLDLDRLELQLKGNITNAYYDLQAADLAVSLAENTVKAAIDSVNDPQPPSTAKSLPQHNQLAAKFEVLAAQLQLDTELQTLTTAKSQQQIARKKIAQLLSIEDNTEITAADDVQALGTWDYSLADSLVLAYNNRPELQQQLVNSQISNHQQRIQSATAHPIVNLVANYNLSKNLSSADSLQDSYSVGVQFNWSLWDGGAAKGRVSQEKINQESIEYQLKTARSQVRFEVEQAYNNLLANRQNIATANQAVQHARESLKIAPSLARLQAIAPTDVSKAQLALLQAENRSISAILNYNRALITLDLATGRKHFN
jgi:outer membrane protein TolC